jgi:alpha 1,3-glucosidase
LIAVNFMLQNCNDAAFCTRLRGNTSASFGIDPKTIKVEGSSITAKILNSQEPKGVFDLVVTSYGNIIRMHINEPAAKPARYEVPDVLLPSIQNLQTPWTLVKKTATKIKLRVDAADANIELRFSPIQLMIEVAGKPLMLWNGAGNFIYEHRRLKQEGDPESWWGENYKSHHDSKPRGPEAISWDLSFQGFDHVYGLPERAKALSLPPTRDPNGTYLSEPYRLYNLDVFEYLSDSPFGLYGSIPLLWAHRSGQTVGAFWLNAAEMYVDVEKPTSGGSVSTQWIAESGLLDIFFLLGPSPADATSQFAQLTGGTALPQAFALGYHQCRWNYKDQEDVAAVDAGFDAHDIPYDVLWLDIEHTDGKRYFTWDTNYFPTPIQMQEEIASRGRKMVTIVDPHIKRDTSWAFFNEATEKKLFVKDKDGNDFDGWCWPGSSSYLDQTSPTVRSWWADQFAVDKYVGSTKNLYIWNDMNEPSVFNGPEITMHKDSLHDGGVEHRDVHNAYGYYYHMATAEGLRKRGFKEQGPDGDRPFVLSRAFFAGTQRIGAIWTGDNGADWDHLEVSVPMLLTIGVTGLPFSGADVGGFFGNPDAELMTRWYQLGAFYPFFRGHAHLESKRREPWLFGEETTGHIREAIRRRYRMLPYIYTLFLHANVSGSPVMRPLWYEFPQDANLVNEDKVFMLGNAIAVAPVLAQGETSVRVVLPQEESKNSRKYTVWYDGDSGTAIAGDAQSSGGGSPTSSTSNAKPIEFIAPAPINTIKHFLRGGTMIPLKERARRSSAAMAADPVTLVIALDANGEAQGDLYLDDGHSFAFQRGHYSYRSFIFAADGTLKSVAGELPKTAELPVSNAKYDSGVVIDKIVVIGLVDGPDGWSVEESGNGRYLEAAPGPLSLRPGLPTLALVVRKAQLPVSGKDWELKFSKLKGSAAATA